MASAEGLDDRRLTDAVDLVFVPLAFAVLPAFAVLLVFAEEDDFFAVEWDEGFVVELLSSGWAFFFF
jgi:hypothetical protein